MELKDGWDWMDWDGIGWDGLGQMPWRPREVLVQLSDSAHGGASWNTSWSNFLTQLMGSG